MNNLANLIRNVIPKRWRPISYLTYLSQIRTNYCVQDGPFKGMKYIDDSTGSAYIPKLLGTYERELNPYIEMACIQNAECIINIGAGEGYYAVGMALRNLSSQIIAFESTELGQNNIVKLAKLNSVENRVKIYGKCKTENLEFWISQYSKILIICDVEGYELILLDPQHAPSLKTATVLVELHDFITEGISDTLISRFLNTHSIEKILQTKRARSEFPFRTLYINILPSRYLDWTVSEWRPVKMSWLWMCPLEL